MVEQIGKMAQQSKEGVVPGAVELDDTTGYAPNTKKRMMEAEPSTQIRDELLELQGQLELRFGATG